MATDTGTATADTPPPPPPPPPPAETAQQRSADLQSSRVPPGEKAEPQGLEPRGLQPTPEFQQKLDAHTEAKAARQDGEPNVQQSADLQSSRVPPGSADPVSNRPPGSADPVSNRPPGSADPVSNRPPGSADEVSGRPVETTQELTGDAVTGKTPTQTEGTVTPPSESRAEPTAGRPLEAAGPDASARAPVEGPADPAAAPRTETSDTVPAVELPQHSGQLDRPRPTTAERPEPASASDGAPAPAPTWTRAADSRPDETPASERTTAHLTERATGDAERPTEPDPTDRSASPPNTPAESIRVPETADRMIDRVSDRPSALPDPDESAMRGIRNAAQGRPGEPDSGNETPEQSAGAIGDSPYGAKPIRDAAGTELKPTPPSEAVWDAYPNMYVPAHDASQPVVAGPFQDVHDWVGEVNPGGTDAPGRDNNCGDCTRAVERNWRGEPQVAAALTDPALSGEYRHVMEDWIGAPATDMGYSSIHDKLTELGPGSSAIVGQTWDGGGGHWFNAVNQSGIVMAVDGQGGNAEPWPPSMDGVGWDESWVDNSFCIIRNSKGEIVT